MWRILVCLLIVVVPFPAYADYATSQKFLGQFISLRTYYNVSTKIDFVRHRNYQFEESQMLSFQDRLDATFRVAPGLADSHLVSLEALNLPGYFLKTTPNKADYGYSLVLEQNLGNPQFATEATFDIMPGLEGSASGTFTFESWAHRGFYICSTDFPLIRCMPRSTWNNARRSFLVTYPQAKLCSFQSANYLTYFIRHRNFEGELTVVNPIDERDATFALLPSRYGNTSNAAMVSLEALNFPGQFLRHRNFRIILTPLAGGTDIQDASFVLRPALNSGGPNWISFESLNFPGYFLRHRNFKLYVERNDGSPLFKNDASFGLSQPKANVP